MTEDGDRSGGAPRAPRPADAQRAEGAPGTVQPHHSDWLAQSGAPLTPAAAPVPPATPVPPAAPAPAPAAAAPRAQIPLYSRPARPADDTLFDETLAHDPLADGPLADELPEDAEPDEAPAPRLSLAERLKRTPPALVILTLAAIGSTGFLVYELARRTAPIAVLSSAAFVTGLCYVAITVVCAIATYKSGSDGRTLRAFLLAFIGGMAAIIAAASFAGGLVLVLALGF